MGNNQTIYFIVEYAIIFIIRILMDYGIVKKSAVPHVTSLEPHFQISFIKYQYTLIVECSFIILILPLLAIWIYFSAKHKSLKKQDEEKQEDNAGLVVENKLQGFHVSEADVKQSYVDQQKIQNIGISQAKSNYGDPFKETYNMEQADQANDKEMKQKLKVIQRKICYGVCFFIMHVISVNSFDTGIISFVTFSLTLIIYLLFNLIWYKKKYLTFGLYIIPAIASSFQFLLGSHLLGSQAI